MPMCLLCFNAAWQAMFRQKDVLPGPSRAATTTRFWLWNPPVMRLSSMKPVSIPATGFLRFAASSMTRSRLSGKVGAALNPCAAVQVPFQLADGQGRKFIFRLGVGRNTNEAGNLVQRFRGSGAARGALEAVWEYWKRTLGAVHVETPE